MASKPDASTKRPRNAFFLHTSNVLGVYEVCVGYKNTRGKIAPLTASKQNADVKIPFGPLTSCEYRERKVGEEVVEEFKFGNIRKDAMALPLSILNNIEFGLNDFCRKVTNLTNDKRKALTLYLDIINSSENFVHHREGFHHASGLRLDGDGVTEGSIVAAGGTLEEFEQFVELA